MRSVVTTRAKAGSGARVAIRIRPAATKPVKTTIAAIRKAVRATIKEHAATGKG